MVEEHRPASERTTADVGIKGKPFVCELRDLPLPNPRSRLLAGASFDATLLRLVDTAFLYTTYATDFA